MTSARFPHRAPSWLGCLALGGGTWALGWAAIMWVFG